MPTSTLPDEAASIAPASLPARLLRSVRLSPALALRLTQCGLLALFLAAAACNHG